MARKSTDTYRFGDLLALARQSWIRQMAVGLEALGHDDYRPTDAAVLRRLQRGPLSIGGLGHALGVTRQAARKVADGLHRRGLATLSRDDHDGRQVNVALTRRGEVYASAVVDVIDRLNRELRDRVDPADLAAADRVLRSVLDDAPTRARAAWLAPPGGTGRRRG